MPQKNLVHDAFEVSLFLKGAFAFGEIIAGIGAFFVTKQLLASLIQMITAAEIAEDPRDFVATHLFQAAQHLSMNDQRFTAIYLLLHGVVKLWLIYGLWQKKLGYYLAAIAVFGFFIAYQLFRYSLTPGPLLLFITALDAAVICLTWIEYTHLRKVRGHR